MSEKFVVTLRGFHLIINTKIPNLFFRTELDPYSGDVLLYIPSRYKWIMTQMLIRTYVSIEVKEALEPFCRYANIKIIGE